MKGLLRILGNRTTDTTSVESAIWNMLRIDSHLRILTELLALLYGVFNPLSNLAAPPDMYCHGSYRIPRIVCSWRRFTTLGQR